MDEFSADGYNDTQATGFFDSARERVSSFLAPLNEFSQSPAGSTLMQAVYNYGAGKIDAAREKAVGAFLMTSEGRKIQAEATSQTANQYLPFIILGAIALMFLGSVALRR